MSWGLLCEIGRGSAGPLTRYGLPAHRAGVKRLVAVLTLGHSTLALYLRGPVAPTVCETVQATGIGWEHSRQMGSRSKGGSIRKLLTFAALLTMFAVVGSAVLVADQDGDLQPARTIIAQALARPGVVVLSGARSTQYKPAAATDKTYDFRGLTSTAYPFSSSFPLVIEGTRNVVIGGTVIGQQGRDLSWAKTHDSFGGAGLYLLNVRDYAVSYGFRVDNVVDGIDTRPPDGDLNAGRFLIEGAYMTWIRDDAIEDDTEMSGTIRDVLVYGVNNAISIGQSMKNPNAVVNVENVIFIHAPMRNDRAADDNGHQTLFKQAPGGRVNLTNVTDCLYENPISESRIGIRPLGTWTNVTFVLGPGWSGPSPAVPDGATVSRDWQELCIGAAAEWVAAHELHRAL